MAFTKEEKNVLFIIIFAAIAGMFITLFFSYNARISLKQFEKNGKININTAPMETLDTLPGIGETIASRIVERREIKGNFKSVYELVEVKGMTKKRFEKIKPLLSVEDTEK
ncbi:MAG: helix-hairpin-helix domain-containing protein [bacterium]